MREAAVVVGADRLARAATDRIREAGVEVLALTGAELADVTVRLHAHEFVVEGRAVRGVLLREPIGAALPAGFAADDWSFVAAEVAATWLAATHLPGLLAVNRLDAEAWFEGGQWPVWRRRLRGSVDLSFLRFGDSDASRWRPYVGGGDRPTPSAAVRRSLGTALANEAVAGSTLFVIGEALGGYPPRPVLEAAQRLRASGLELAAISHDAHGRVVAVDPFPAVPDDLLEPATHRLAQAFGDHLRRR